MFTISASGAYATLDFDASNLGGMTVYPEPDFDHTTWEHDPETGVYTMTSGRLMALCLGSNPAWGEITPIEID